MLRFLSSTFISLILLLHLANGQVRQSPDEVFRDANAYFYFEDYEEALALYLRIYQNFPDNSNLDYRIGICFLNISGRKDRAIPYLERASQSISRRYNENSLRETNAPVETLFYLGNAYFINNQLDKAEEAYIAFRDQVRNERRYDMEYFYHQLEGLKRSRTLQRYPVNFIRSNLGPNINSRFPNFNAVISGDGKSLAYTTKERFYQAIYVARKEGDTWGRPQNITLDLVVDGNCETLSLSYYGDELYLFKDDDHVGNIYVTNYVDGSWTPMKKLNENINTQYYETHASLTPDGKTLYFTSNREGGVGDLDIYASHRQVGGDWGPAKNIGSNINTRFNENTPFVTNDGKTLFFSSEGHNSMGGYDIFFSNLQPDGTWSRPINLGYPINTTDDDLFYFPIGDGSIGLMAVFDPSGYGETDITKIEIFLPRYQRSIVATTDYFERRATLPPRTLVVDTVNISGVALLDPSILLHRNYLDSDEQFTLFFDGKPYEVRNQAKAIQKLGMATPPSVAPKPIEIPIPVDASPATEHIAEVDEIDRIEVEESQVAEETLELIPEETKDMAILPEQQSEPTDTIPTEIKPQQPGLQTEKLLEVLAQIGPPEIKDKILTTMSNDWQLSSTQLKLQSKSLAKEFALEERPELFVELFSRFLDIVNLKATESHIRQSRQISRTSAHEDFFFRVQRLKKSASSELSLLIDDAIITQPDIMSFSSLWQYLIQNKKDGVMPLLEELIAHLVENSIEGYFALPQHSRDEIQRQLAPKHISVGRIITLSLVSIIIFVLAVLFVKRKKEKKV